MKKRKLFTILALTVLSISGISLSLSRKNEVVETKGYSSIKATDVTTINLKNRTLSEVKNYYKNLNGLSASDLKGTNLLKNLKPILKDGQLYFNYDSNSLWDLYEITDRDWVKSPASAINGSGYGSYDSDTETITGYVYGKSNSNPGSNPYVHALYVNRDVDNQTRAWGNHNQDGWGINQEHIWAKANGFETSGAGGARGDPMHLWAGNGYANNIHSNNFFGYVDKTENYTDCGTKYPNLTGNLSGTSLTVPSSKEVFEPQDSDKGDIARAIFYMAARYNYYSGSDGDGINGDNPNLILVQDSYHETSGYQSTTETPGTMGIISDLLEWNRLDPPDEWEIRRNNILFNSYTKNRNPFIDYPQWAEYVWGNKDDKNVNFDTDVLNSFDDAGQAVNVTGVSLDKESGTIEINKTVTLNPTITPSNATNKSVKWKSSDNYVATVNEGVVTGVGVGTATISCVTVDGNFKADYEVTVTQSSGAPKITASVVIKDYAEANNWQNRTKYETCVIDDVITATASGNANTGKYYTNGYNWRFYRSTDTPGELTITSSEGYIIRTVTLDYVVEDNGLFEGVTSGVPVVVDNDSVSFVVADSQSGTTGKVFISSISVTYSPCEYIDRIEVNNEKTFYEVGEAFVAPDVIGYPPSGNPKQLTSNVTFSDVDTSTPGTQRVNVYYTIGDWVKTTSYTITVEAPTVTAVTVSPSSLALDLAGTATGKLSATVTGTHNPSQEVEWSSSDQTVASIDNEGNVTAHKTGSVTISAKSATNETVVGTATVTVTDSQAANHKSSTLVAQNYGYGNEEDLTKKTPVFPNNEIQASFSQGTNPYNPPKYYTYDKTIRVYGGNSMTITSSKANIYKVVFNFIGDYNNEIVPSSGMIIDNTWTGDYIDSITFAIQGTKGQRRFTFVEVFYYSAGDFSNYFLNNTGCDESGKTAPTGNWTTIESKFNLLYEEEQQILKDATPDEHGTTIEHAMKRYNLIIKNWGYKNFIGRTDYNYGYNPLFTSSKNNGMVLAIVIIGTISISSITIYLLTKKKKVD